MSASDDAGGFIGIVFVVAVVVVFLSPGDSWSDKIWYSVEYMVAYDDVHIDARPKDCDWGHAPMGDKGCKYKARVRTYNVAGRWVGGDFAPQYGNDVNTGKPIVSWDEGKTWDWFEGPAVPDLRAKSVEVNWNKIAD